MYFLRKLKPPAFNYETITGIVFVSFLELYKRGEGSRIIESLNSLKFNPIIE